MKQNQVWMNFTGFVTSKNVMDSTLLRKLLKFIIDIRPKEIKKKKKKRNSHPLMLHIPARSSY